MENTYAIDGLKVKLAEIASAIREGEKRLKALAHDRGVIIEALRIMGSDPAAGEVSLGIASGAFSRTILEVIRDAPEPLGVRGIAEVLAARAGRPLDKREFNLVVARVRNAMPRLSDKLDGEIRGRATFWRVKDSQPPPLVSAGLPPAATRRLHASSRLFRLVSGHGFQATSSGWLVFSLISPACR